MRRLSPLGWAAFAAVCFLSVLLRLLRLSHWAPSLYRVLLESAFLAVAAAAGADAGGITGGGSAVCRCFGRGSTRLARNTTIA